MLAVGSLSTGDVSIACCALRAGGTAGVGAQTSRNMHCGKSLTGMPGRRQLVSNYCFCCCCFQIKPFFNVFPEYITGTILVQKLHCNQINVLVYFNTYCTSSSNWQDGEDYLEFECNDSSATLCPLDKLN